MATGLHIWYVEMLRQLPGVPIHNSDTTIWIEVSSFRHIDFLSFWPILTFIFRIEVMDIQGVQNKAYYLWAVCSKNYAAKLHENSVMAK